MMVDLVVALENWFAGNCDGDWEHGWGVHISSLDNPGWAVDIDLSGTPLAGKTLDAVRDERTEHDWVHCWIEKEIFKGRGGPKNLGEILEVFLRWSAVGSS